MYRSIAESASSASTGIGGLLLSGLYSLFDETFPTFFMFCSRSQSPKPARNKQTAGRAGFWAYLDLLVGPAVHAERLNLGDMCAEFTVDRRASHAQEDAQLPQVSLLYQVRREAACRSRGGGRRDVGEGRGWHVRSMMPSLRVSRVSDSRRGDAETGDRPGFRAWQSAHWLFPGTFWTRSCRVFSLRACWRLLRAPAMFTVVAGRDAGRGEARPIAMGSVEAVW